MSRTVYGFVIAVILAASSAAIAAPAAPDKADTATPAAAPAAKRKPPTPPRGIESYLKAAFKALNGKQPKEAGVAVRQAVESLKQGGAKAEGKSKQELESADKGLARLAERLEQGKEVPATEMRKAFAETHLALAQVARDETYQQWMKKDTKKSGKAMLAEIGHVARAAEWSEQKLDKAEKNTLKEARAIAGKSAKGEQVNQGDADKAWNDVGDVLKKVGRGAPATK